MTWYLVVRNDHAVDDPLLVSEEDFCGVDADTLKVGQPIRDWNDNACLRAIGPEMTGNPMMLFRTILACRCFQRVCGRGWSVLT